MITLFFILLAVFLVLGVPIFIALSGSVLGAMLVDGTLPLAIVVERLFAGLDKFALMAIPFFILSAIILSAML